jgi:RNA polymerase sigma-70 factor (ECF subfamily)
MGGTDVEQHIDLVHRIATGDPNAFTELYEIYLPLVLRWCLRSTGDRELAADLSAEVFAAALLSAGRYRAAAGTPAVWLIGIAHNKLRESRRRRRVEDSARRRLGVEPVALIDADLERVDELVGMDEQLQRLVDELPADQRLAIVARVVDERSYEEIAAELRCSESVVRQRVSRGLRSLRSELEER